jgi:hypothetical protein
MLGSNRIDANLAVIDPTDCWMDVDVIFLAGFLSRVIGWPSVFVLVFCESNDTIDRIEDDQRTNQPTNQLYKSMDHHPYSLYSQLAFLCSHRLARTHKALLPVRTNQHAPILCTVVCPRQRENDSHQIAELGRDGLFLHHTKKCYLDTAENVLSQVRSGRTTTRYLQGR